jgi:hypothetical protein
MWPELTRATTAGNGVKLRALRPGPFSRREDKNLAPATKIPPFGLESIDG